MKLKELLSNIEVEYILGDAEIEIGGVESNFYTVRENDLFVYPCNVFSERLNIAGRAIARGATAILSDGEPAAAAESGITLIKVRRLDDLAERLIQRFYGNPRERMTVIGVTGTKGKTTTAHMIAAILRKAGYKTALQTTIGMDTGKRFYPAEEIAPNRTRLYSEMLENGVRFLIEEYPSVSIKMGLADNIRFDTCVYTNLSEDHVGNEGHPTFEDYAASKARLFGLCERAVINGDDSRIVADVAEKCGRIETFGMSEKCDLYAQNIERTERFGIRFRTGGVLAMEAEMPYSGSFSAYNAMAAMLVCRHFGVETDVMRDALAEIRVEGRLEEIPFAEGVHVFVDYAHNGVSLENVLGMLKGYRPQRLICLFGCGGKRPIKRRTDMGRISGELADLTVITADNSRGEDLMKIIGDIESAVKETGGSYTVIPDREKAVLSVLADARPGDTILLAGMGHEWYLKLDGGRVRTNDRQVVEDYLSDRKERKV